MNGKDIDPRKVDQDLIDRLTIHPDPNHPLWTEEDLAEINAQGDVIIEPEKMIWTGNVDVPDLDLSECEWTPGQVVMDPSTGEGCVDPGRKCWGTTMHQQGPCADHYEFWHSVMDPIMRKWLAQLPNVFGPSHIGRRGQIVRYETGHWFALHQDGGQLTHPHFRTALGLIYLTDADDYEGGIFRIPSYGFERKFTKGDWLIFPSVMFHELTPVTKGERFMMFGELFSHNWGDQRASFWLDQCTPPLPDGDPAWARQKAIGEHYGETELRHNDLWIPEIPGTESEDPGPGL